MRREPDLNELLNSDPCAVTIAEDVGVSIRAVDAWLRREGGEDYDLVGGSAVGAVAAVRVELVLKRERHRKAGRQEQAVLLFAVEREELRPWLTGEFEVDEPAARWLVLSDAELLAKLEELRRIDEVLRE